MMNEGIYFNRPLQNDNVFVDNQILSMEELTGKKSRKGLEQAILSEGEIVNVVSKSYGHLPNEDFFIKVEEKLIDDGIKYDIRSINRDNRSFSVDYILNDDSYHIHVKNGIDKIRPMLRFTNSYDGSCKTSGHFGFFREVCHNGLHLATSKIGFSVKHRGTMHDVVIPEIKSLVTKFMNNEFYELKKKFDVLAERPIYDLKDFVKVTAEDIGLFKYECSDTNDDPSLNARTVLETISKEASLLKEQPNAWIGYNAFNEILHNKFKKTFGEQKRIDSKLFNSVLSYQ